MNPQPPVTRTFTAASLAGARRARLPASLTRRDRLARHGRAGGLHPDQREQDEVADAGLQLDERAQRDGYRPADRERVMYGSRRPSAARSTGTVSSADSA